jgi:hypothetical protein
VHEDAGSGSFDPRDPVVRRVAQGLGVPPERVAQALSEAGMAAGAVGAVGAAAGALRAEAVDAAIAAKAALQGTAEEALAVGLEVVAESVPRMVNHTLAVLAASGVALVALGALAILNTTLFVHLLAILAGIALVVAGGLLFTLAWRLHEATASLRTLARIARTWRARRAAAAQAAVPAVPAAAPGPAPVRAPATSSAAGPRGGRAAGRTPGAGHRRTGR